MGRIVGVLTVIALFSGIILALFADYTQPKIAYNDQIALDNAIKGIFPEMTEKKAIEKEGVKDTFEVYKDTELLGYAFKASGNGFQDKIELLVGIDKDFAKLIAIEVLKQSETPGLGDKIRDPEIFKDQFKNVNTTSQITYVKNQPGDPEKGQIKAITGATISSRSVVNILNATINDLRNKIKS